MPLLPMRSAFDLPAGIVYLDGNSLGPLPHVARERIAQTVTDEWGQMLIGGWNAAGWMDLPEKVGNQIGRLIGAPPGTVTAADSTSINVHKVLAAALQLRPDRRIILSDTGNFPTDLYMAKGLIDQLGRQHQLKLVEPEDVSSAIDETVAAVMLTEVDYRTGRLHDMSGVTKTAHDAGAVTIWDLAHSAGALSVDLHATQADFAIGCGYKYLNGGPGAPAFLYVHPKHLDHIEPVLSGWLGHASPFDFDTGYRPADGIGRMRVGTPPILSMASLDAALGLWDDIDVADVRTQSIKLSSAFIEEVERRCPAEEISLASPRDADQRGSQVSFRCENGYPVMQALIVEGVIGDFRAPNLIRFGFAPLYNTEEEVRSAARTLAEILRTRRWDKPQFHARAAVT
ncbi:MAG: kynureninase [Pseudomonadota bacterium]